MVSGRLVFAAESAKPRPQLRSGMTRERNDHLLALEARRGVRVGRTRQGAIPPRLFAKRVKASHIDVTMRGNVPRLRWSDAAKAKCMFRCGVYGVARDSGSATSEERLMSTRIDPSSARAESPESPTEQPAQTPRSGQWSPSSRQAWELANPGMPGNAPRPRSQDSEAGAQAHPAGEAPQSSSQQPGAEGYRFRRGLGGIVDHMRDMRARITSTPERVAEQQANRGLRRAALAGDEAAVDRFISEAQVDAVSPEGHTALHNAVRSGSEPIVQRMLDAGADPNVRNTRTGQTALHFAAGRNESRIVRTLLADPRTKPNIVDHAGKRPHDLIESPGLSDPAAQMAELDAIFGAERLEGMRRAPGTQHPFPYPGTPEYARPPAELPDPPAEPLDSAQPPTYTAAGYSATYGSGLPDESEVGDGPWLGEAPQSANLDGRQQNIATAPTELIDTMARNLVEALRAGIQPVPRSAPGSEGSDRDAPAPGSDVRARSSDSVRDEQHGAGSEEAPR